MDFIDRLINILGNKIKIKNKTTYLKDTLYILDHDYLGNELKQSFNILSSENLVLEMPNHNYFKKDVLYYKDNVHKVYVYYDIITLQYLGYSEDNKNIKKNKNNASLKIQYSIKDCLLMFGLENMYTNLYHIDSSLINDFNVNSLQIMNNLIRTRIINLKQIINRSQSIINAVRNHGKINRTHNIKEKEIINEFITKLKKFNLKNSEGKYDVFKHSTYINNLIHLKKIVGNVNLTINQNYINNNFINKSINADTKLMYYIIMNFNRLLDYNTQPAIESELAYLIIRIIEYSFNTYLKEHTNFEVRQFDYLNLSDAPYADETIRLVGYYQELITVNEIDEQNLDEKNYDAQEELDAFDVDDYDVDDDIDGNAEAFDGGDIEN
jgi:hypothetical protein